MSWDLGAGALGALGAEVLTRVLFRSRLLILHFHGAYWKFYMGEKQTMLKKLVHLSVFLTLSLVLLDCGRNGRDGAVRHKASGRGSSLDGSSSTNWRCLTSADPCFKEDVVLRNSGDTSAKLSITYSVKCVKAPSAGTPYFLIFGDEKINLAIGDRQSAEFSGPDALKLSRVDSEQEGVFGCSLAIHGIRSS